MPPLPETLARAQLPEHRLRLPGKGNAKPDGGFASSRFIEKPDAQKAQQLLLGGNVLWNAGIFLCQAANSARDGDLLRPDADSFSACRSESIDYAVIGRAIRSRRISR